MPLCVTDGGQWKNCTGAGVVDGGQWKAVKQLYTTSGGAWRLVFPTSDPEIETLPVSIDLFATKSDVGLSQDLTITEPVVSDNRWISLAGTINNTGGNDVWVTFFWRYKGETEWRNDLGSLNIQGSSGPSGWPTPAVQSLPVNARVNFTGASVGYSLGGGSPYFDRTYIRAINLNNIPVSIELFAALRPYGSNGWFTRASNMVKVTWRTP